MEIGSVVHQGDVYVHRLPDDWPCGERIGADSVQVALGTGNGARHMAEGPVEVYSFRQLPDGVMAPAGVQAGTIGGPVIKAKGPWSLTHPEHAHHRLPKGTYGVTYQYDPRTMRRVID